MVYPHEAKETSVETADLYDKLTTVFRDVFAHDTLAIKPELTAKDVEGWDSLNHIRLILSIEKAFGVKFAAHEVVELKNIGQLAELIRKKSDRSRR